MEATMTRPLRIFRRGLAAGIPLLAAGGVPVYAQIGMTDPDAGVVCGAFARAPGGVWTATAPTTLNYTNGMVLNIAPGEMFAPNRTIGGVEVSSTLDRHCSNE
jgi:hypothetical protein